MNLYQAVIEQAVGSARMETQEWLPVSDRDQAERISRRYGLGEVHPVDAEAGTLGVWLVEVIEPEHLQVLEADNTFAPFQVGGIGEDGFRVRFESP